MKPSQYQHFKYKICVSGAAETGHCGPYIMEKAKELGEEIALAGAVLVNGATTGFPLWASIGAKKAKGFVIGISPAFSKKEHIDYYKLPIDCADVIIYTGFGYSGRNLLLTRAADAVIIGCGRMGTLNEFTIAFEDKKPIGVLLNAGGTTNLIKQIIKESHREKEIKIIYESEPKKLVENLIKLIDDKKEY